MPDFLHPATVPYRLLKATHPTWDGPYWKRCEALYAGGKRLLADPEILHDVFPKHTNEDPEVYKERCKRAYYLPYAGEILDQIVSALVASPVVVAPAAEDKPEDTSAGKGKPAAADYWTTWAQDVSKPGGRKLSLNQLLREQILTALIKGVAWTLVDLPNVDPEAFASLAEQEAAGALNPYAVPIAPENVRDWEEDESGELLWALIRWEYRNRGGLTEARDTIREDFTYYTPEGWARYSITYKADKPPKDEDEIPLVGEGTHTFGHVPLVRLALPEGLWAMGKIESVAVAHLNKRNALTWAEFKSLFPVPVAYLGPADQLNPAAEDEGRATSQKHGPGYMRVMAEKDRMEYFGPDPAPFTVAQADLAILRDEMHRVLHQMAMSVDNSGAALQRSGDSKAIDQAASTVVLRALGVYTREHAVDLFEMAQAGLGQEPTDWNAQGMDSFDQVSPGAMVEEAVNLEAISIPSATFQVKYKLALATRILGAAADEETVEAIESELKNAITPEMFEAAAELAASGGVPPEDEGGEDGKGKGGDKGTEPGTDKADQKGAA